MVDSTTGGLPEFGQAASLNARSSYRNIYFCPTLNFYTRAAHFDDSSCVNFWQRGFIPKSIGLSLDSDHRGHGFSR